MVLLPGVRYFSQAPLLWFAREAAQAEGWSVLEVSERAPRDMDPFAWMGERAERALAASAAQVAFVGKSLASVAAPLATQRALPAVWLTPLLDRPEVAAALAGATRPTLIVGSPTDPTWSGGSVPESEALGTGARGPRPLTSSPRGSGGVTRRPAHGHRAHARVPRRARLTPCACA